MNQLLASVAASIIMSLIIFILLQFNVTMSEASFEILSSKNSQENAIVTGEIIEYDLYKIGYKVNGEKITNADSTSINYLADYNNNNNVDTISYYVGNVSELNNTSNPEDRPLYRKVNADSAQMVGLVTDFNFAYFDSSGTQLNYNNLNNASIRTRIRSIRASFKVEAGEQYNSVYQGIEFLRIIRPRNLNI